MSKRLRKVWLSLLLNLRYVRDWLTMLGGLCLWSLIFIPLPKSLARRIEKISAHRFLTGPKGKPNLKLLQDSTLQAAIQEKSIAAYQVLEANRHSLVNAGMQVDEALKGVNLNAWHLPAPTGRPTVVLHHGRGSNLMHLEPVIQAFRRKKLGLLLYDYPGFGRSGGVATPDSLNQAGVAVSLYAKQRLGIDLGQQVHVGNSLGSMVAARTAQVLEYFQGSPLGLVVLVNPLPSFRRVFAHLRDRLKLGWLLDENRIHQDMEAITPLGGLSQTPVVFVRGRHDRYIPQKQVEALFEAVGSASGSNFYQQPGRKRFQIWEETRHRLVPADYQKLADHIDSWHPTPSAQSAQRKV